jgi:hypothetical protein
MCWPVCSNPGMTSTHYQPKATLGYSCDSPARWPNNSMLSLYYCIRWFPHTHSDKSRSPEGCQDLKNSIQPDRSGARLSYAQVAGNHTVFNHTSTLKLAVQTDLRDKQIFVLTKQVDKSWTIYLSPPKLKKWCNSILTSFFKELANSSLDIQAPLRGVSRSVFTFHRIKTRRKLGYTANGQPI